MVRYLLQVPSGGDTDGAVISRFYTTGTISYCDVIYNQANGGELTLTGFTGAGATLFTTGAAITAINGLLLEVSVELQVSGGNITYQLAALKAGGTTYYATGSGTLTSASMGLPFVIYMNNSGSLTSTAFGHVQVYSTYSSLLNDAAALAAHAGETAAARINRLGTEQGISTNVIDAGASDTTILMGPQLPEKLITLLQECEDADRGLIYEPRGSFGIEYRTRASLYSQTPAYSLSYPGGQVAQPLAPTEDDQLTRNDVTVSRTSGSSFEDTLTSGPLSIQDPPNGVGQYSFSLTANVLDDGLLPDLASWILWVGTQSDLRYPTIAVDLFRSEMLYEFNGIVSADLGDFMQVVSPPFWLPPGPISQLVYGYTETLAQFTWTIVSNCVPEIPYEVGVANTSRTDTDGSILHTGIGTTSTSFSVDTPVPSAVWVDSSGHAGEFPFDIVIDGERMVVTAISGTTTPQVFTVTRGVDGVTTAHNAGAMVNVYRPAVTGM